MPNKNSELELEQAYQRYLARTPKVHQTSREQFANNWNYIQSFKR